MAPMVRVGTLPARIQALQYGADIVFCEEVIDHRILTCKRIWNDKLGTVDFQLEDDEASPVIFRTCPAIEKHALVFQMGTSQAQRALSAAKMVEDLVSAVDVNMGCPKAYSIKGGMGAALLTQTDKVKDILTTLVNGLNIPVTCKIRLLGSDHDVDVEATKSFVRACCSTGIAGITVHGRTREERPRHPNHDDDIAMLKEIATEYGIPLVANGGSNVIKKREDVQAFRLATNADSVMLARAAMWDLSIFRKEGPLPREHVVTDYLRLCVRYDNSTQNTKYVVQQMLQEHSDSSKGRAIQHSATIREVCCAWEIEDVYEEEMKKLEEREITINNRPECKRKLAEEGGSAKRTKEEADTVGEDVIVVNVAFVRKEYPVSGHSPKSIVVEYAKKNDLDMPSYETFQRDVDKMYRSILTLDHNRFSSERWEKSKKYAEQAAALAFLTNRNLETGRRPSPNNFDRGNILCETEKEGKGMSRSTGEGGESTAHMEKVEG